MLAFNRNANVTKTSIKVLGCPYYSLGSEIASWHFRLTKEGPWRSSQKASMICKSHYQIYISVQFSRSVVHIHKVKGQKIYWKKHLCVFYSVPGAGTCHILTHLIFNNLMRKVQLLSQFYRWRNWDSQKLNICPSPESQ